jgi:hypothetical protein
MARVWGRVLCGEVGFGSPYYSTVPLVPGQFLESVPVPKAREAAETVGRIAWHASCYTGSREEF